MLPVLPFDWTDESGPGGIGGSLSYSWPTHLLPCHLSGLGFTLCFGNELKGNQSTNHLVPRNMLNMVKLGADMTLEKC